VEEGKFGAAAGRFGEQAWLARVDAWAQNNSMAPVTRPGSKHEGRSGRTHVGWDFRLRSVGDVVVVAVVVDVSAGE
jgi:hypothetical protein